MTAIPGPHWQPFALATCTTPTTGRRAWRLGPAEDRTCLFCSAKALLVIDYADTLHRNQLGLSLCGHCALATLALLDHLSADGCTAPIDWPEEPPDAWIGSP